MPQATINVKIVHGARTKTDINAWSAKSSYEMIFSDGYSRSLDDSVTIIELFAKKIPYVDNAGLKGIFADMESIKRENNES